MFQGSLRVDEIAIADLRTLLHSVRDELLAQSIIYDCLSTIITADIWNYKTVDCFLDRFFATTMYAELGPSAVVR